MKPSYELTVVVDVWDLTPERVAEDFKRLYEELKRTDRDQPIECQFVSYNIIAKDVVNTENPEKELTAYHFTDEMFEAEDFIERFAASKRYYDNNNWIYVKTIPEGADPDDYDVVYAGNVFWED